MALSLSLSLYIYTYGWGPIGLSLLDLFGVYLVGRGVSKWLVNEGQNPLSEVLTDLEPPQALTYHYLVSPLAVQVRNKGMSYKDDYGDYTRTTVGIRCIISC